MTETIPRVRCSVTGYPGGNGVDQEALAWNNIDDMLNKWGQASGESHETFLSDEKNITDVVIAIVDDGISQDMWLYIENETNCEIEQYLHWDYETRYDPYLAFQTTNPYLMPTDYEFEERHEHGSQIAWAISQAANGVKLWILDVQDSDFSGGEGLSPEGFYEAFTWLYNNKDLHSGLDIVSISNSLNSEDTADGE